jgi:hypothetical protein
MKTNVALTEDGSAGPCYGYFNGPGWGVNNFGLNPGLEINNSCSAAFTHDQNPANYWQWVADQYTTHPSRQWVGPVGASYAVLGTAPFGALGFFYHPWISSGSDRRNGHSE